STFFCAVRPPPWSTTLSLPAALPISGLAIAELLHEAGIPADVFQALVGGGEVGAMLLAEPVDAVCFTGSHATGVKVAAAVAPRLDRKSTRLNSSHVAISYAVFCLKKK